MFLKFASLAACLEMLSLASFRMFHVRTIGPTKKTCMSTILVSVTKHFQSEHGIRFPIINGRILATPVRQRISEVYHQSKQSESQWEEACLFLCNHSQICDCTHQDLGTVQR